MRISELFNEGMFDRFKKKEPKSTPTKEEVDATDRAMIAKHFEHNTTQDTVGGLKYRVTAHYKNSILQFTKENGQLTAERIIHHSEEDRANPKGVPISSETHIIDSEQDLVDIKSFIDSRH